MTAETHCADCGLRIIVDGPEDVVQGIIAEPVLCQRCDPDYSSLTDNKYHRPDAA
jgi:hydrogenase maturation factor HypF (carbamoyltransferase family)